MTVAEARRAAAMCRLRDALHQTDFALLLDDLRMVPPEFRDRFIARDVALLKALQQAHREDWAFGVSTGRWS